MIFGAELLVSLLALIALRKGNPGAYYIFFRWSACPLLCWIGWKSFVGDRVGVAILAAILAAINNPVFRVMMSRDKWEIVNLATIGVAVWSAIASLHQIRRNSG